MMALSAKFKEEGNRAFAAAVPDYESAVKAYTSALLAPDVEDESVLYSNRCAAYASLFQFDLALLDADKAVELKPEWSRAYARRAECYSGLGDLDAASAQYELAISHSSDPAATARFNQALAAIRTRRASLLPVPIDFGKRVTDLEKAGKTEFVVGGTVELVFLAWGWVEEGFSQIERDVWKDEDGFGSKVPSGILVLADAVLAHPLAFHIPPSSNSGLQLGEKLRLQYQYDIQVFSNERYLIGDLSVEEIFEELTVRAESDGWVKVRTALAHLIRGQVVMAFVEEATGAYASSIKKYRYVLAMLEEGAKAWAGVVDERKGTTFRRTFRRSVQVALMLALEEAWSNAKTEGDKAAFGLDEIQAHAEEVMDDCVSHPTNHDPENPTHWLTFQILPLVHAAKAIAFVLVHRSQLSTNTTTDGTATYFHPTMNLAATQMYRQAAVYLPLDDPDRPVCLYLSLNCSLRAGGLSIAEVFSKAAEAEAAMPASEPVFGPVPRAFAVRTFVRAVCDDLRSLLQLKGAPGMDAVLKPIPRARLDSLPGRNRPPARMVDGEVEVVEAVP